MAPKKPEIVIEYLNPRDLKPYEKNAKAHGDTQIARLVAQFKAHGFDVPIVVDADHVILKGHARRAAAIKAGMKTVPTIVRGDLSETQKRAIRIADNRLAESDWDIAILREEIGDILGADLPGTLLGFGDGELAVLMNGGKVLGTGTPGSEKEDEGDAPSGGGSGPAASPGAGKAGREVQCPGCGHRFAI